MIMVLNSNKGSAILYRMNKNKYHTSLELIVAATTMQEWFTKLAEGTKSSDAAQRYNLIRLEMGNVLDALTPYNKPVATA